MTTVEQLTGAEEVEWDLSDLYAGPDDPKLEAEVADAERRAAAFRERYHDAVADLAASDLAEAIAEREEIESAMDRALTYAHLRFATNMADPARGALLGKLQERAAAIETTLLFFGLELAAIDDGPAEALLADPALERWRHWVTSLRKYRPHLLTEPEERVMTEKSVSGSSSWSRLYSELLSSLRATVDGEQLPLESVTSRLYLDDRDVRRTSAEAVTEALAPGLRTRTFVFNTILQDKSIDDRLRRYPSWISSRNLANETTDDAVEALVEAVVSRYEVVRRYYRLKARLLGLERLEFYDRFAPVSRGGKNTSWEDARALTIGAYSDFSPAVGEIVEGFFTKNWIDGPVRADKANGAFCATTVPGVHPYVLMNYTGDRRSVLTLAHELGHGVHGVLAQPLGLFNASCPLTTSETASVFGEALTFKRQLSTVDDPRQKLDLLTGRLEDAFATTFRQISMNRFEHLVHTERRGSGELAPERIGELWLESQEALFGDSVGTDGYATWWSYIPHFMSVPGYVYAYSYGYLFALTVFRRYEQEGDALVEPYLELLSLGGSRSPVELAKIVGLDLTDPSIWSTGIDALSDDVDAAERLAAEIGLGQG
jgi:oligoendopeptidase F